MKSMKWSKELLSMLVIVLLLTGFSYGTLPGRLSVTNQNIQSVSVDDHERGRFNNYNEPSSINNAVEILKNMKEVSRKDNGTYRENRNFTIRFNFRDGSSRTFFVHYFIHESLVYLNPFNTDISYEVPKSLIDPLLQISQLDSPMK